MADFTRRLAISYYKTIAVINEDHHIYLVQHQESHNIFIKKILDVYNMDVYQHLYTHPVTGTPRIVDYCEDNNRLTIIEEYVSGCSLSDKIKNSLLTEADILGYMTDLCNILETLHSFQPAIIHRDIKPSNIIITHYNRAVLLDFNAAKHYSFVKPEDTVFLGTQGYAAPEQYGFGASSPQTDIYALGILLKEMLASLPQSVNRFHPIINRCTQINPSERFANITELKKELHLRTSCDLTKLLPPGFRTKTPWKMFLSSIFYIITVWLSLSLTEQNVSGFALWGDKILFLAIVLSVVFCSFNYMNIQRFVPLCQHKNRMIRYIGIAVLNITVIFFLFLIFMLLEEIFLPTK
jgi:serine/threonine protein kinase